MVAGVPQRGAIAAQAVSCLSLGASTLHLGRPIHAWRGQRMCAFVIEKRGPAVLVVCEGSDGGGGDFPEFPGRPQCSASPA